MKQVVRLPDLGVPLLPALLRAVAPAAAVPAAAAAAAAVPVRVVPQRQLHVRPLDVVGGRVPPHAEDLVRVPHGNSKRVGVSLCPLFFPREFTRRLLHGADDGRRDGERGRLSDFGMYWPNLGPALAFKNGPMTKNRGPDPTRGPRRRVHDKKQYVPNTDSFLHLDLRCVSRTGLICFGERTPAPQSNMLRYYCTDLTTKGLCLLERAKVFTIPPLLVQTIPLGYEVLPPPSIARHAGSRSVSVSTTIWLSSAVWKNIAGVKLKLSQCRLEWANLSVRAVLSQRPSQQWDGLDGESYVALE
ncbi:hypothetical protein THAOC_32686 [Thalassiosira oceanica]|uniref:Uncharacterized protein n=1 Tax=Thalassiosira oceanica TaxID=159749 RepID=K0R8N9_THAOC|nr:hypothetical protein THAOC_32686 [Thalassiosira oceanica]|eukprot:EJK48509.1 hypothetical protein THAOC_32686 [Thalassiosira oceanica]